MADPMPDPFEAFRKLWGPLGLPLPGWAMPTLDPAEIEKRIADLRSVEGWLSMNLNMVKLSIQGFEVQRSALLGLKAAADGTAAAMRNATPGAPEQASNAAANPVLWPWAAMQPAGGKKAGDEGEGKG